MSERKHECPYCKKMTGSAPGPNHGTAKCIHCGRLFEFYIDGQIKVTSTGRISSVAHNDKVVFQGG
jgi:transcription elongation factor Elf1